MIENGINYPEDSECVKCGAFLSYDRNPVFDLEDGPSCENCFDKYSEKEMLEGFLGLGKKLSSPAITKEKITEIVGEWSDLQQLDLYDFQKERLVEMLVEGLK